MNESNLQSVLNQLEHLKEASPNLVDTTEHWINTIHEKQTFLDNRDHSIVFIGSVGVGKSSLIGVTANLLVDEKLTDKTSLKKKSVLSIGAGRTTVCEVCIRALKEDETGIGLIIEPVTEEEMQKEITIYAETEWNRRQPDAVKGEDDTEPTPQEIQRVIRNMTGYMEYQESFIDGNKKKRRTVRPLDEVVSRFDNHEALSAHLIECAKLSKRKETAWWWNESNVEHLQALKTLFENINQGKESTAMLPRRMTVVVPELLSGDTTRLALTLIDTRGLDGPVESRADLYKYMRDSRSIMVLCAPFKNAPGESLRTLLHAMTGDAELRQTIPRTLLVLIDQNDAEQVNGADGDREFGQDLKIEECHRVLESAGLLGIIDQERIIAFDALQDDRNRLQIAIDNCLTQFHQTSEDEQRKLISDAETFIKNAANELRPELCNDVDKQIKKTMALHRLSSDAPLRNPLAGLFDAIRATRYAAVVYASCRRNGAYSNLDLYAAIRAKASREATLWLDQLFNPIITKLKVLKQENSFALIHDHISLREQQYQEARLTVISDYAVRIEKQVHEKLKSDSVWHKCVREWGLGDGFKNRVLGHLEEWESRQQGIIAHETTNAIKIIPLLSEVSLPPQAPQFTLYIRNLRVLRQVSWTPTQLNVVIGANGSGKTTLLLVLKLLQVAYQRSLPEAVTQILGGSSNLKTIGISEEEPVEIGIDIDTISWRIQLVLRESSVELTKERLTEKEREIFYRDGLGAFFYGSERIEPDSKLGLRTLMDRGVAESALRKVASFLQHIAVYHDPDLWHLRWQGSNASEDRILHTRGINALALLRRWYQELVVNYHRYQFVVEGLAAAFPNTVEKLDFVGAGNTLVMRIYQPGQELPSPLAAEANGVLQLLVLFCEVANAENESLVAIDEPENCLHPYALRAFLRRTSRWARQHNLTVLLATHSTVLLDELSTTPEQVYVMTANERDGPLPTRLDKLYNREWLENFKLGDLYEQGEIGSNEDED